ncbi:hypothetical protein NQT62_12820 [Limnobacter humi]|uniref:Uncharacterized protein n=1 Tax=Limnobacter humi TaxID=1778671 RepID=A0ABT1WIG8_9BURK|nr:hypothetical protein [Limnobacter humi]MCQ8897316.1 hypothetical protein [Limnobacter humi]
MPSTSVCGHHPGSLAPVDTFSLSDCKSHVLLKAGLKALPDGRCITLSWTAKLKNMVMGNNAQARYRRADFESRQLNSCALWSANYLAASNGVQPDLKQDKGLQLRLNREDFRRFNRALFAEATHQATARNRMAARFSRVAKWCNGVGELGAAPTGMLLQIMKDLTVPNRHDSAMGSQVRAFFTLVFPVFPVVAMISTCLTNACSPVAGAMASSMGRSVVGTLGSYNAVTGVAALCSLGGAALAAATAQRSPLSDQTVDWVQQEQARHSQRLLKLVREMIEKPGARMAVNRALRRKIPPHRCVHAQHTKTPEPILVDALIQAVRSVTTDAEACQAIDRTMGRYLNVRHFDLPDEVPHNRIRNDVHSKHRLAREKDILALTNLIQHARLDAVDPTRHNDVRTDIQDWFKQARTSTLGKFAHGADAISQHGIARAIRSGQEGIQPALREQLKNKPEHMLKWIGSNDQILANHHQYGPVTVFFARVAEGLRVFSHGVLLSTNYQLTRPFAWAFGRLTELLPNVDLPGREKSIQWRGHQSRAVSFSVGRFFSSAIWAVVDAFLILPLAGGHGVAYSGQGPISGVPFPLKPFGQGSWILGFSVISTALQMVMVAGVTMPAVVLAKAAFLAEGWRGNLQRIGPALSKRERLQWR